MRTFGLDFNSRVEFYASHSGAMDQQPRGPETITDETDVRKSAERCFEKTNYFEKIETLAQQRIHEYLKQRKRLVELTMYRYEKAEQYAIDIINLYCDTDKDAIVSMYEVDKYTKHEICIPK